MTLVKIKRDSIKEKCLNRKVEAKINLIHNGKFKTYVLHGISLMCERDATQDEIDSNVPIDIPECLDKIYNKSSQKYNYEYEQIECNWCKSKYKDSYIITQLASPYNSVPEYRCPICNYKLEIKFEKIEDINDISQN